MLSNDFWFIYLGGIGIKKEKSWKIALFKFDEEFFKKNIDITYHFFLKNPQDKVT